MAYVIGILVAVAILVGSAAVVLVAIARVEEILPPPRTSEAKKPANALRGALQLFSRGRLPH